MDEKNSVCELGRRGIFFSGFKSCEKFNCDPIPVFQLNEVSLTKIEHVTVESKAIMAPLLLNSPLKFGALKMVIKR